MSQENVEIVRRGLEAYSQGDFDAALADTPVDAEWEIAAENPNARTLRGPDEIRAYFRDWQETLSGLRYEIDELVDAGDAVVCLGRVTGRAGNDGPEVTVALATSLTSATAYLLGLRSFSTATTPSKPWGCRSKTRTQTPESPRDS
jgi:uncharacterized protein